MTQDALQVIGWIVAAALFAYLVYVIIKTLKGK